ncbi:hypothetical protein NQ176_g4432 [Zarea fungicola]|uniref:Uncharacterized protein n=1 Tax=Zarea fungicola TaxID=93591 RepID=A0ACC1NEI3_9HYPO|nr:hypothetical protein NQ176_g4432 [Lecanicillium fungicola]
MKSYALLLLIAGVLGRPDAAIHPNVYKDGDRIHAPVGDVDQGYGTFIQDGISYAFQEPPNTQHWYMSNEGGNDLPHWRYLPNAEIGPVNLTKVPEDTLSSVDEVALLDKRQRPPAYLNYYNNIRCDSFDAQNKPVTIAQCVWNRSFVAWSSIWSPGHATCFFITQYYNSGCGIESACGGYISQSIDLNGCYTPSRIFCATSSYCCIRGC